MTSALRTHAPALSVAVHKTLVNTFFTITAMMGITACSAFLTKGLHIGTLGLIVTAVLSLVTIFLVNANRKSAMGLFWMAFFSALSGVTLGAALKVYLGLPNGVALVGQAAGVTAAAVASCAGYALVSRRSFARYGAFLFAGLVTVLVASVIGIFVQSPVFHLVLSSVAALLFVGYLLYDISAVVNGEETNYVSASLSIYLDIFNLFLHLLRIFGILGDD